MKFNVNLPLSSLQTQQPPTISFMFSASSKQKSDFEYRRAEMEEKLKESARVPDH